MDKNLKYHGLIQAFFAPRTAVLNGTKPYGNIMDFRHQEGAVNDAITLFSNDTEKPPKEIWLVDPAPEVIKALDSAVAELESFMHDQGLPFRPEEVNNLKGDTARAGFIERFKEVQRLRTRLEQYTDLSEEDSERIETLLPQDQMRAFKGMYLETAQRLKAQQDTGNAESAVQALDFEFVLFSSAVIDYDYIMSLIARYTQSPPTKEKMTRDELINLLSSSANLMDERGDIIAYINSLEVGKGLNEREIRRGYEAFKERKAANALAEVADKHGLETAALQTFVGTVMDRMIFDGERLTDLLAPLELGWKARRVKELALMDDLVPLLKRRAQGREISGLAAYE